MAKNNTDTSNNKIYLKYFLFIVWNKANKNYTLLKYLYLWMEKMRFFTYKENYLQICCQKFYLQTGFYHKI